jgi:segregation and condensation protein B
MMQESTRNELTEHENGSFEEQEQKEPAERDSEIDIESDWEDTLAEPSDAELPDELPEENPDQEEELAEAETIESEPPEITPLQVVEAVLFAGDEPVTPKKLAEIVGAGGVKEIKEHIEQLNQKYEQMNCAFRIETIAGGFLMLTQSAFNVWLRKLLKVRSESKLTPASLETLAIIAYKQPVMRVEVEAVRGVGCGEMIRQLCEKQMVKIVGRAEELGRPLLYGTTRKFLEVFGLSSLKDLPQAEDLKAPS